MTFRSRIILGYAALLFLTVAVLLLSLRFMLEQFTLKQLDMHHAFEAHELVDVAAEDDRAYREEHWRHHLGVAEDMYKFLLHDDGGRIVYRSPALVGVTPESFEGVPDGRVEAFASLGECWVTRHSLDGYTLHIVTPVAVPMALSRHFYKVGLVVLAITLVLSVITGALYATWLLRPLVRMEEAAVGIDNGTVDRIPAALADSNDEVGRIARRLNAGYDRTTASLERLRVFSAEVSHELRTPLSVVSLNAERMRDNPASPGPVREMADEQIEEIARLKRFIANLLGFAKLDAGAVRMEVRPVAVSAWLDDFAEDAALLAEDAGFRFEFLNETAGEVRFDPVWMRQVLFNLLSNAFRFSPPGGVIRLSSFPDGPDFVMILQDEGPGVPVEKLSAIFERYIRFGEERGPSEGVGLGLAISRSVVELHAGTIRAENRGDRSGLRVVIRIPANP